MGTRTNFYKNPCHAYNKRLNLKSVLENLTSYNIATGNAPADEPPLTDSVQPKRRRVVRPPPEVKSEDGPMSHQEYIATRRKQADYSSQCYQELTADVLENSSSFVNIVGYESDASTSAECEEDQGPPTNSEGQLNYSKEMTYFPVSASIEEAGEIKTQTEQRFPAPGDPVCVVCGKYGEYICNETNDDICSMECKAELLQSLTLKQEPQSVQLLTKSFSARRCTSEVPESGGDTWDFDRHRWSKKISGLCTYECWKCGKPGHLAEDCLVIVSHCESSSSGKASNQVAVVRDGSSAIPRDLHDLYKREGD